MSPTYHLTHHGDLYEITFRKGAILVVKYCGDSQFQREVEFESLPEEVQSRIVSLIEGDEEE